MSHSTLCSIKIPGDRKQLESETKTQFYLVNPDVENREGKLGFPPVEFSLVGIDFQESSEWSMKGVIFQEGMTRVGSISRGHREVGRRKGRGWWRWW